MRKPWMRQSRRRFKCPPRISAQTCEQLLHNVWDLDWNEKAGGVPPGPYSDYWINLRLRTRGDDFGQNDPTIVGGLVTMLRTGLDTTINDLKGQVYNHLQTAVQTTVGTDGSERALAFAINLWTHVYPDIQRQDLANLTLKQVIKTHVPPETVKGIQIDGRLSDDFCFKHLFRKGGISIAYIDDINDHLTFDSAEQTLLCFRHSNMLRRISEDPSSDPFPPGFVEETLATLHLLFRPFKPHKARYNVRQMEKHMTDLELAMATTARMMQQETSFELNDYRYWHKRLKIIQEAYDRKKPATLRQWCFDRRDRVQWATFWVAFIVFALTVIFGVIQSVTGILQVWVAYHPSGP